MEYRFLGKSGLKVSALSYGAWVTFADQIDESMATRLMSMARDAGVNFFDNAEVYARGRAETLMGKVLKSVDWPRTEYVLSTKIFWGGSGPNDRGLSRKHILEGTDAALKRLQVDYVDLIFCHRPDLDTPLEETVRAMNHLIQQGKALYWGTSEWSAERIRAAVEICRREHLIPPTMEQPEYNMFRRENMEAEYLSLFDDPGIGTTIWSPLASGLLTGKYNDGIPDDSRLNVPGYEWLRRQFESTEGKQKLDKVRQLIPVAQELETTLPQLAIAWCVRNPHVSTAILGATRPEQLEENLQALELLPRLTTEVMNRIDEILDNRPESPRQWRG